MIMAAPSGLTRFWSAGRRLSDRTPLRVKLTSALLALVAVALAVIGIAGISVLRSYQLGQADNTLQGYAEQSPRLVENYLFGAPATILPGGGALAWLPYGGHLIWLIRPGVAFSPSSPERALPVPSVPASSAWLAAHEGKAVTVAAKSGDGRWRVVAFPYRLATPDGSIASGIVIVGLDVTDVYATIAHLTGIDLIMSLVIILVLAIVGITVVRSSLRPLTEIEQTAQGIAAGDLSRRVPDRDPRTEVGRLGRSLNAMLSQIEFAFRARADSETAARRSEERMRQFVADASHELRTPLTTIRGFAEYYRQRGGLANGKPGQRTPDATSSLNAAIRGNPAPGLPAAAAAQEESPLTRVDLDRIMRRVEQESTRMGVLVEDMLLLARLDQQRPLDRRPVDLLTLAADAVHDARVMAPERSIDLTLGGGAALIVLGDEVRLRQVIGNLMSNALIHTPDGTPVEVRIRPGTLDEWPPVVILEVADRGPGLTPGQAERAFERFYRADQARQAGGTGLGLAIVAALVAAHGGAVRVEPTPGGGATFRIAVPMAPEVLGPGPGGESGPDPSGESGPDPSGESGPGPGGQPAAGPAGPAS